MRFSWIILLIGGILLGLASAYSSLKIVSLPCGAEETNLIVYSVGFLCSGIQCLMFSYMLAPKKIRGYVGDEE